MLIPSFLVPLFPWSLPGSPASDLCSLGWLGPCFYAPWHFLYFFPLPHGQGSLRPTFSPVRRCVGWLDSPPPCRLAAASSRCFLRWNSFSSSSIVVEGWRVGIAISRGAPSPASGLRGTGHRRRLGNRTRRAAAPHPPAARPARESASGTGTAPCLPGTSASSLRTCRTTRACIPPADLCCA